MKKKHQELLETLEQFEKDLESSFHSNVSRITEFSDPHSDFGLIDTIPINREERITHISRDFRLWADNYDNPQKSHYVNFSYLSIEDQLKVIFQLERIEKEEDLKF
jgi:hypothetical protein